MRGVISAVILAGAVVCPPAASTVSAAQLQGLRWSTTEARTRIVLDLDQPTAYKHWTLGDPPRVLLTLPEATVLASVQPHEINGPYLTRVRVNELRDGRVQVVLDLKRTAEYRTFTLDDPARIVIDVLHDGPAPAPPADPEPKPAAGDAAKESRPVASDAGGASKTGAKADQTAPREHVENADAVPAPPRKVTPAVAPHHGPWKIAIDAGHGGNDSGANHERTKEKDVALALAVRLQEALSERSGFEAFLVRKGDYYIPLRQRWTMAEEGGADIFVSIHCDAGGHASARGTSVFFLSLSGATDEASRELAESENEFDRELGLGESTEDLQSILFDMTQTDVISKSEMLADTCLNRLFELGTVYDRGVRQAGFAVLKSPRMPSVLVEAAFLSNPAERKFLTDKNWQKDFGHSLANGIETYCRTVSASE